jgi:hypothetical protein
MPTYLAAVRDTRNQQTNQQTSKQAPKRFVVCLCGARFFFLVGQKNKPIVFAKTVSGQAC